MEWRWSLGLGRAEGWEGPRAGWGQRPGWSRGLGGAEVEAEARVEWHTSPHLRF